MAQGVGVSREGGEVPSHVSYWASWSLGKVLEFYGDGGWRLIESSCRLISTN